MARSFNGSEQISTFIEGLNMDTGYNVLSNKSYIYGQNIRLVVDDDEGFGSLQAIEGFKKLNELEDIYFTRYYRDGDNNVLKDKIKFDIKDYEIIGLISIRNYVCIFTKYNGLPEYNVIFRLLIDNDNINMTQISSGYFNIGANVNRLSIVSHWEDFDNIKVYWADGIHPLRFINISESKDLDNFDKGLDYFDSNPSFNVYQPELNKFVSGNLKSGMIQYSYQLFTKNGAETTISPLSSLYHLTKPQVDSVNYQGVAKDVSTGKSISIKFKLDSQDYNRCRIYSLHYNALDEPPVIKIVSEFNVNPIEENGQLYQYFTDPGTSLSELSVSEFISLNPYYFIPRIIESKGDRLFASNVTEDTWVLPGYEDDNWYDTRAFRFSKNDPTPHSKLLSTSSSEKFILPTDIDINFLSNKEWKELLPDTEDCINPINTDLLKKASDIDADYEYYYDKQLQQITDKGGSGRNVSFKIVHTKFGEDSQTSIPPRIDTLTALRESLMAGFTMNVDIRNGLNRRVNPDGSREPRYDSLDLYYSIPSIKSQNYIYSTDRLNINGAFNQFNRINYGNPILDTKYRSYQRDELYRFGVVFYNKKGQTTPVNWIADIRMPSMSEHDHRLFDQTGGIRTDVNTFNVYQIVTYPMGLQFFFENLPEDVKQIEIVRSERKLEDRSIVTQGIIGKAVRETGRLGDVSNNVNKVRPLPVMTYSNSFGSSLIWIGDDMSSSPYTIDVSYDNVMPNIGESGSIPYIINSPEISYFGETISDYFSNINVQVLYGLSSPTDVLYLNNTLDGDLINRKNDAYIFNSQYWFNNFESTLKNKISFNNGKVSRIDSKNYLLTTASSRHDIKKYEDKVKLVAKLYNPFNIYSDKDNNKIELSNVSTKEVTDSKLALNIDYLKYKSVSEGLYSQNVGSDTFQNWTADMDFNSDNIFDKQVKSGPNGASIYIKSIDITNSLPSIDAVGDIYTSYFGNKNLNIDRGNFPNIHERAKAYSTGSTFLVNIKKASTPYNGLDYAGRTNSIYISTSFIKDVKSPNEDMIVFGGDTYIGINEYINQHWFYLEEDPKDDEDKTAIGRRSQVVYYYPCESSINHALVHGSSFFRFANDNTYPHDIEYTLGVRPYGFTQERPLYAYNSVYSAQNNTVKFLSKGMYTEDNKNIDFRTHYSEAKTNDEISDSWLKYKVANYLDVDTRHGAITNLKNFNNTLYFWQDDSFGAFSVNPRSLITDNNSAELMLGKGDVLENYNYITTANGCKDNVITNIAVSPSSLFWYDHDRNEILSFTGESLMPVSKTKSIQTHLNKNKGNISNNIQTLYDKKYNEVHFRFNHIDNSKDNHIVFNEQIDAFTSFYTYDTDWFIDLKDSYYSIYNNDLYKHNSDKRINKFFKNTQEDSIIRYVINDNSINTKVFDNIEYFAYFNENNNFDTIKFKTNKQTSQPINKIDIDLREDNFRSTIPRSEITSSNYSSIAPTFNDRMRGKYLISELTFKPNDGDTIFKLPYIKTSYRISNI